MRKLLVFILIAFAGCTSFFSREVPVDSKFYELRSDYYSADWQIRRDAVIKMRKKRSSVREDFLIDVLRTDGSAFVRIEAYKALSRYRSSRSYFAILGSALKEGDYNAYHTALTYIKRFGRSESIELFTNALKNDDWLIREAGIKGLLAIKLESYDSVYPQIITALNDEDVNVQIAAMNSMKLKDERIKELLLSRLSSEGIDFRVTYLKALLTALNGYEFDAASKKMIISFISHRNREVRILALRALKRESENQGN